MHAKNLAAHDRVELVGIYDVDAGASAAAAADTGSASVDSVEDLLGVDALDAVMIASSTSTHCELIERAARAGKAVLCEKRIDLDMSRVDACGAILAVTGVPFQIGFNRRFDPSHDALRRAARDGEIGRLEQKGTGDSHLLLRSTTLTRRFGSIVSTTSRRPPPTTTATATSWTSTAWGSTSPWDRDGKKPT